MAIKLVGGTTRIWTYRAQGIVPPNLPSEQLEAAVRASVGWNDAFLSWIKGTDVSEETLSDSQVQDLMAEFQRRMSGH